MKEKESETQHYPLHKYGHRGYGHAKLLYGLGFIGALAYYLHAHSGTLWLVILAFVKAAVWPAFLVYHLMLYLQM